MKKAMFETIERYMLELMRDSAHDCHHIYRVLYSALDIAAKHDVDRDVLVAACLLHDIGREAQYKDPACDHAEVGAKMAYSFLVGLGWTQEKARHVSDCIRTHRFRSDDPSESMEAKILFDADKLDATGAMGIARTLIYNGIMTEPLYEVDHENVPLDGTEGDSPSFFQEYHFKLKKLYDRFYTQEAAQLAKNRQQAAEDFYQSLLGEVRGTYKRGLPALEACMEE